MYDNYTIHCSPRFYTCSHSHNADDCYTIILHHHTHYNYDYDHGTGRRVAELELYIGLSHIVRSFQLSSEEDVRLTQRMLFVPDKPINIAFVDLHM